MVKKMFCIYQPVDLGSWEWDSKNHEAKEGWLFISKHFHWKDPNLQQSEFPYS